MDTEQNTRIAQGSGHLNTQTVDIIFDLIKGAPERQIDNSFSLDTKIIQIFQVATVTIGLAGFASGNLAAASVPVAIVLVAALLFYGVTTVLVFRNLNPKKLRRSLQAHNLWPSYWNEEPIDIKHALIDDSTKAYAENRELLDRKAGRIRCAVVTTGIEVVLVSLALVLARMGPDLFVVPGQIYRFISML